ncbi:exocyst complex component Sec3 [Rhizoctonia solani AG-3 Rhs1AP]|uniref:Exocyst complex component Sec3 n=1 Tax=Rhizoctonia solani AG-3 Rhs1AP TaxID=1086054 RepID=X8JIZ5_9AGAM|nr:exocyst complex component Sec3 [Rhizoctonia solani AG-3 Rhs1AP]
MTRPYRWQTENEREQTAFLQSTVQLFYRVTGNKSLTVVGLDTSRSRLGQGQGQETRTPSPAPPSIAASESAQSFHTSSSAPRRGVLRPPSISSLGTSVDAARSRTGSAAGSFRREVEPEPQLPTPRAPKPQRAAPQSYASDASGPRSRPTTPSASLAENYPPALPRSRRQPQPSPPATPRQPSWSTPTRNSERSLHAASERERFSQAEKERISLADTRPLQPSIVIPSALQDGVPSPRMRTPVKGSPSLSQNTPLSRIASKATIRPPSPPSRVPSPTTMQPSRRDPNARISYFDPTNQAVLERLLQQGADGEAGESALANVEDMLDGFEWQLKSGGVSGGAADQIEARLKDELMALEKANIHSFVESDDRLALVLKFIDDALGELNDMDSMISSYKVHLNAVGDDISYIQSQNRGLQVQTQNQKTLLNEIEQLLKTVHVDRDSLLVLTQESLESQRGIQRLEDAAAQLYRALLAGRDRDMSATIERLAEYKTYNQQFCIRILEFLGIMFGYQSDRLLDYAEKAKQTRTQPVLHPHTPMENYLIKYNGLMLYLREMDENRYSKVCAAYFSAASDLHNKEVRALFMKYIELVQRAPEEDGENSFAPPPQQSAVSRAGGTVRRAGTVVSKSPMDKKNAPKLVDGDMPGYEAFDRALDQVLVQIHAEDAFISRFLHITDSTLSYADYMNLDNYFKRQASRGLELSDATLKLVRGAMDLIFGFLPQEIKSWVEGMSKRDPLQLVGVIAVLQRYIAEAQERNDTFVDRLLGKPVQRLNGLYQRQIEEQLQAIEQTKLTTKKRKGVAHFIRYFPTFVGRIEPQLVSAQTYEIRKTVDGSYERIVQAMFEALQQMAKMDGTETKDPDDKGVLNYHVIMIENMHHFVADMTQLELGAVRAFVTRAEDIYSRELSAYVTFVLRRPMAKIIDYFDGVERLLQTTAPSEISNNNSFSRSALKKVVKEYDSKDMRKNIDGLYKRVEKHFDADEGLAPPGQNGAAAPVLVGVWNACEEQLLQFTENWIKLIGQCYPDSGVSLEYTISDVKAAFKRHRTG